MFDYIFRKFTQNIQNEPKKTEKSTYGTKGQEGQTKRLKIVADMKSHVCLQIKVLKQRKHNKL